MSRGNKSVIVQYKVSVLSLEVQRRIVNILDSYVGVEDELLREVELRREQLETMRDYLLGFE